MSEHPSWPKGVTPALSGNEIQRLLAGETRTPPPWPIVSECHYPAPSLVKQGHSCPQCDASHDHEWAAWHDAPQADPYGHGTTVTGGSSGPGIPVRCVTCGGRKCDLGSCLLRRHHRGDHEHF